ncbi:PD-(D/E)XK motif protein [Sphingopyxis sp. R3-92]|uniref:PD-(D/E)XK motif protein n=1 Tax=Sphingopyxis sp. R3-92 TaxID=3158553 RepID=UPI003EE52B0B
MTAPADLENLWFRLAAVRGDDRQFVSLRVPGTGGLDVHVALRSTDRARCLLFDLTGADESEAGFEAGGLRLLQVMADGRYMMALVLEDRDKSDLFGTICSDLIHFAAPAADAEPIDLVMERLDAWQYFLRSLAGGLSAEEVTGLTGELHILDKLVSLDPALVRSWCAPADGVQDFEHLGHALEVKTTAGPGWQVRISNADQLDDEGLRRLDLLHVRLTADADGETLEDVASRIRAKLPDERARQEFSNALVRRGLSPGDRSARAGMLTSLQKITAFRVTAGFPRLIRPGFPPAIVDVHYTLDLGPMQHGAVAADEVLDNYGGRNK